ncbi:MAG: sensor histidine kinase [Candidatus Rokubacteria bacterium]|nr:sensor histidine kinase [Candidatus Rokubacteria bacterium]
MGWRIMRRAVDRYREMVLAVVFLGMGSYELLEIWMLELPRSSPFAVTVVHSLQVLLILAATATFLRAWREKTAHEEELSRMVEKVIFAQERERQRIAYDVHDGIAQLIVSAKQHLDTCNDVWRREPDRGARELAMGLDRLERAVVETRRVLMALRPSAIAAGGLVAALRGSVEEAAGEAGWSVTFSADLGETRLAPAVETAVYRIAQEALANAARHANTSGVEVELRREDDWLVLDVLDRGAGFAVDGDRRGRRGLGLHSMRERARLLGGTCTIESEPQHGTRVSVRLPLEDRRANGIRE